MKFLFSTKLMAILFVLFAFALGLGTFIENEYNTDTARMLIYNAWWFELMMLLFVVNFFGNIKTYRLQKKSKWATLLLHLSFVIIIIGSLITRYISFEGTMSIREGETTDVILSDRAFLTVWVDGELNGEMKRRSFETPVLFSGALEKNNLISKFKSNGYYLKNHFNEIPFEINLKEFVMSAEKEEIVEDANGKYFLKIVESATGERHDHYVQEGTTELIHNVLYAFNNPTQDAINFTLKDGKMTVKSPFEGEYMIMATRQKGSVLVDVEQDFHYRSMYKFGNTQFVADTPVKGKKKMVSNGNYKDTKTDNAVILTVKSQGQTQEVVLKGNKGKMGMPQAIKIGKLDFTLMYGSKIYQTPFKVKLNDFIADKYPGSNSYKSYESKVTVIDKENTFDYRIYMNNILDYGGYRFFQAQFDPDEKGTILSVNHDFWGTWFTYIGYTLLYIGLFAILFVRDSRFSELKRKLSKIREKKSLLTIFFLMLSFLGYSQDDSTAQSHNHPVRAKLKPTQAEFDSLVQKVKVPKIHADKFGSLVIQDNGRMKPLNTFTSELLRKVSQSDVYKGLTSDQVFISMCQYPQIWHNIPIIKLKRGNDSLRSILSLPTNAESASFMDFFDERTGAYKLEKVLEKANNTAQKNQFEKDFIEIDKRVILMSQALSGSILKVFPLIKAENNKWISTLEVEDAGLTVSDSTKVYVEKLPLAYEGLLYDAVQNKDYSVVEQLLFQVKQCSEKEDLNYIFIKSIFPIYNTTLLYSVQAKDENVKLKLQGYADDLIEYIHQYQRRYGSEVIPSDSHIQAEILYNRGDVFKRLFSWYIYASVSLFILSIIKIFKEYEWLKMLIYSTSRVVVALFFLHTLGLIARWYVSGHAPLSDAYESIIYVGWATMLFGLIFGKKSELTIASTAFVAGMIMMVAHWNWMDPAISNLQPVLNSYWLMIHVAVIVASYGPFALGMIIGVVSLLLMVFMTRKNKEKMKLNIRELTYINEMALTVGLVLLTVGNFLGGQWANESWGRYWGWDPKETWALVSIMVYSFVIHMRLVPFLRGAWLYNFVSIISFYAILMTYFGVNFYLSGLHSYAKGDQVVTPSFIWWSVAIVGLLGVVSYFKYRKHYKK